jgi:purine-nucleoside phosphorylase
MEEINELIIMYPKDQLEDVVNKLKNLGFVENEKPRIEIGNKLITNLLYNGKEKFNDILNQVKDQGISYEIPGIYKTLDENQKYMK